MIWKSLPSGLDLMGENRFSDEVMLKQKAAAGSPIR
jgi:hypothetical protein